MTGKIIKLYILRIVRQIKIINNWKYINSSLKSVQNNNVNNNWSLKMI